MKKVLKVIVISILMMFLVGCDSKKEVVKTCTLEKSVSGYSLNSTYKIYATGNEVKKVETEEVVTSDNESVRSYFETQLNNSYSAASKTYGGYTYDVTNKDNKVTSKVTIDYEKMDLDKFIKDNASIKQFLNKKNKVTLDGVKSIYSTLGATCEE